MNELKCLAVTDCFCLLLYYLKVLKRRVWTLLTDGPGIHFYLSYFPAVTDEVLNLSEPRFSHL